MKERFTKFIDTIIALDKGDHTLTDKQWMKKQKMGLRPEAVLGDCACSDLPSSH